MFDKENLARSFWPIVDDLESAKKATRYGFWASILCAVVTVATVILGYYGIQPHSMNNMSFDLFALFDAALFAVIAWGLYKMSRTAAVAGLSLYFIERIYMWSVYSLKIPVMAIIVSLLFVHSIRGTFAYHRL